MTLVLEHETAPASDIARIALFASKVDLRRGFGEEFTSTLDFAEIVETSDIASLIRVLGHSTPTDLAVVDLATPGLGGLVGLLYLRSQFPGTPFLTLTASGDPAELRRCVEAGAAGVVSASASTPGLAEAVGAILDGEIPEQVFDRRPIRGSERGGADAHDGSAVGLLRRLRSLTPQQMRVLILLCGGLLNKQIAYELTVSEATVKAHVSAVLQKLAVDGRVAAVEFVAAANGGLVA